MAYFIAAYLVIWIFLMGYMFYISRKVSELRRRINTLTELLDQAKEEGKGDE
jgi:CcmD family protein